MGAFLFYKGLVFLDFDPVLIGVAWLVGLLKGYFVLSKTVEKGAIRLMTLPTPIRFRDAYGPGYLALMGVMIALGVGLRFVPTVVRGMVDVAVGIALMYGAYLWYELPRSISRAR